MTRWTLSPVFVYECAIAARRWQTYASRAAFLSVLFLALLVAWVLRIPAFTGTMHLNDLARVGETFFVTIAGTQLVLVLLAAPAYLAASICLDKARGTLTHMLVTDLSAAEIVVGKLGARAMPLFAMLMASVPVLVLATLLGGVEPWMIVSAFFVVSAVALVTCALALALSVWANKPHEVLLAAYVVEAIWLLAWPTWELFASGSTPDLLKFINPFHMILGSVIWDELGPIGECAVFVALLALVAGLLTLVAILTLRYANQRGNSGQSRKRRWPWLRMPRFVPAIDLNPVLWREWQRHTPSRWLRVVWGIYVLGSLAASAAVFLIGSPRVEGIAAFVNAFVFSIGLLLVSITSVATLFEERVNGSLDTLLTTRLTTPEIVWGKWLASFRTVVLVSLLPMLVGFCVLAARGRHDAFVFLYLLAIQMAAHGMAINSLGLALATWISRFGVAVGLTVTIYALLAAGPVLWLLAIRGGGPGHDGFASLSSWYGIGLTTFQIGSSNSDERIGPKILWTAFYVIMAGVLIAGTLRLFDRCMGRARGRRSPAERQS